jgi:aldose 1-epimerase
MTGNPEIVVAIAKYGKRIDEFFALYTEYRQQQNEGDFAIANKQLDDCFVMNDAVIEFETNEYQLKITSDASPNYLQMYTPPHRSLIAIEPMTGISNSFNNGIGLQVLAPSKTYTISWNLTIN